MHSNNQELHRRPGSVYFVVLSMASLVTVIGLAALSTVRVQRQITEGENDLAQARLSASSAVDLGRLWIAADANWRTKFTNGDWATGAELLDAARGTFSVAGVDPVDGDLADSADDPLLLTGTGVKGQARHKTQVKLLAQHTPLTCLQVAMQAGVDITFNATQVTCDQIVCANRNVTASSPSIASDVEAGNTISGSTFTGARRYPVPPRTMPAATVFDYYISNGTTIPFSSLAGAAGPNARKLENLFLSPSENPYGATNPQGIYVINCAGGKLNILSCRIVGTLVILDPDPASPISGSISMAPAVSNFPALLTRGSMVLQFTNTALSEASTGVNFNPDANATKTDTYPSKIQGLVYVSGNLSTSNAVTVEGNLVVGGTASCTGNLTLKYASIFNDNPPPGFRSGTKMVVASGSWKQIVD